MPDKTYPSYQLVPNLHDYQRYIHDYILEHPYCGLFLDCGLGKTLITLSALYDLNPHHHVLVIAPKHIARCTWTDEIEKWKFPFNIKSFIVDEKGNSITKQKSHKLIDEIFNEQRPSTLYFINRERLVDLIENLPKEKVFDGRKYIDVPVFPFKTVILDESQSFKSRNSKRFKALQLVRPQVERLIELTGTPAPNGVDDLWSQIYLLDQGQRLGRNITEYRRRFCTQEYNQYNMYRLKPKSEEVIKELIKDITISVDNPNLDIPSITYNNIFVHMGKKEMEQYKQFKREAVFTSPDKDIDPIIAVNAAVLSNKLIQMASGSLYINEEHDYTTIHKEKIDMLDHILSETPTPTIVAYYFNSDKEILAKELKNRGYEPEFFDGTPEMVRRWNNNEIKTMLLHPASAGHGLNLQTGDGHTLVWYTIPWNLEYYQQTNARLHRQGQKNPVVVHHILTKDTIDESVLHAIENKKMDQDDLIKAVKGQF